MKVNNRTPTGEYDKGTVYIAAKRVLKVYKCDNERSVIVFDNNKDTEKVLGTPEEVANNINEALK
jgi:hypothetical protein